MPMKEMYYILGLAGWIWLALVAPLMIGFSIVKWHRRKATRPGGFEVSLTEERPAGDAEMQSRRTQTSDEEQS
jgi:hypothetical protein